MNAIELVKQALISVKSSGSEKMLQGKLVKFLESKGCWVTKNDSSSHYVKSGVPDIVLLWEGEVLWIEVKKGNCGTSALQKKTHQDMVKRGGVVYVVGGGVFKSAEGSKEGGREFWINRVLEEVGEVEIWRK
jgi:hypothetical protein